MLRLNNPKGAFTAAGSRLSIRRKAGPMGQLAVVRFCRTRCAHPWFAQVGSCRIGGDRGGPATGRKAVFR